MDSLIKINGSLHGIQLHIKIDYLDIFESCPFQMALVSSKEYNAHDYTPPGEIQTCIQRGSAGKKYVVIN